MALLTVQQVTRAGIVPSYQAAAGGGDNFAAGSQTFLHVKNGGGGSINVTVAAVKVPIKDTTISNLVVAVANGAEKMIGPFPPEFFGALADGTVGITYSGVTSVTVAAISLIQP